MTTIQDRILEKFDKNFELREMPWEYSENIMELGGKPIGGTIRDDGKEIDRWYPDLKKEFKQFLIQSIKLVEEETRKEVVEECKQKMAQSNEWWNDKLKSLSPNKEVK